MKIPRDAFTKNTLTDRYENFASERKTFMIEFSDICTNIRTASIPFGVERRAEMRENEKYSMQNTAVVIKIVIIVLERNVYLSSLCFCNARINTVDGISSVAGIVRMVSQDEKSA